MEKLLDEFTKKHLNQVVKMKHVSNKAISQVQITLRVSYLSRL